MIYHDIPTRVEKRFIVFSTLVDISRFMIMIVQNTIGSFSKMDFRIEIFIFKLVYKEKIMLFGRFGRELFCFEHLDISLDLTGICCCSEKISLESARAEWARFESARAE